MLRLIVGPKGSGKTKKLIAHAKKAVKETSGSVLCIEKGSVSTFSIPHEARLVDMDEYPDITTFNDLYTFICGLLEGNYDYTDILIDSTLRIGGRDMNELTKFMRRLKEISKKRDLDVVVTISCPKEDLPNEIYMCANAVQ